MKAIASGVNELKSNLNEVKKLVQKNANFDQKKEYQVQVTIIEARGLIAKDQDGSDPYVKITVGKLPPQVTNIKQNASTVVFNQSFTFKDLFLNNIELENQEIVIQVIDQNQFALNPLIGQQSIGLSTLYRSNNHEFFKTWLSVIHPDHGIESQGYVLVSCYIIGTEDRPPVHDINEAKEDDEEVCSFMNVPDEELTEEQRKKKAEMKRQVVPIQMPASRREQYQLLVSIVKGEDFPILTGRSCDSFVSCRVGGNVLRTPVIKNTQKPNYQTKMVFPVFFPVFNDKIVMRIWDSRVLRADTFIACVPEKPNENDWFNINTLHSRGGTMSYRWFHLYGVPLNERPDGVVDEVIKQLAKQIEGTYYMGRILLSLSLSPNEKAGLGLQPLGGYKEPGVTKHVVRCDTFEIQSSKDCGDYIMVEVSFGGIVIRSNLCQKRSASNKEKQRNAQANASQFSQLTQYVWKDSKSMIEKEIQIDIPLDQSQQPDLIVSLYSVNPKDTSDLEYEDSDIKRLAYLRIKASAKELEKDTPKWFQMRPVQYKTLQETHSHLLMHIQLQTELVAKQKTRHHLKRSLKQIYLFSGSFWGAYDLCPSEYSDNILVSVCLQIGTKSIQVISGRQGKNVIWNNNKQFLIELDEKLEFSSNIILTFFNKLKKGLMGEVSESDEYIGQIAIKADSCAVKSDQKGMHQQIPQKPSYEFYHIMNDGKSNGRILASFQLTRSEKTFQQAEQEDIVNKKILEDDDFKLVQLQFPLIGVRNLPEGIKEPEFVFRIPQPDLKFIQVAAERKKRQEVTRNFYFEKVVELPRDDDGEEQEGEAAQGKTKTIGGKIFQMIEDVQKIPQKNLNFCTIIANELEESLKIPADLQFVPVLELELREKNASFRQVRYHTVVNLIDYVPWGEASGKMLRIEYFDLGKYNLQLLEDEDKEVMREQQEMANQDEIEENLDNSRDDDINEGDLKGDKNQIFTDQFRKEIERNVVSGSSNKGDNEKKNLLSNLEENKDYQENPFLPEPSLSGILNKRDEKSVKSMKSTSSKRSKGSSASTSLSARRLENQKQFKTGQIFNNAQFNPSKDFSKTEEDEKMFLLEREEEIKELSEMVFALQELKKKDDGQRKKLIRRIEELKNYVVKENTFLDQDDDNQQENFDYGREIVRVPLAEQLDKGLPYKKYALYRFGFSQSNIELGIPTNAVIKAHLRLVIQNPNEVKLRKSEVRSSVSSMSVRSSVLSGRSSQKSKLGFDKALVKYRNEEDDNRYPFDIFKRTFLNFFRTPFEIKARLYLLRGTNISAQASKIELYHLLAGENAVCSSSSYPFVFVGDGENKGKNIIKNIKDDNYVIPDTLNPEFFRMYELDACLPEDWNLVLQIFNKGAAVDQLIGQFEVDLEDRLLGQKELRRRIAYSTYIEYFKDKAEKYKYNYEQEGKKASFEIKVNELITKMEALDRNLKLPVEYLELKHPQKNTCQGTIEFFLEPFPHDVARIIPPSIIEKPKPMEFEIRVIVWETFGIPKSATKNTVDIFLNVSLDSTANIKGEDIVKETDTHFGSEDGNGIFNYRLKFPFVIPCPFPRLRLQVFDFSTVGANESLGETVITLKKAIKKLKEGIVFSMPTTKFKFEHPNYPGQDRGQVSISIKIVNKQVAESEPVGEGQEEPNMDPILEKPKEGRNAADFFRGTALDFSAWSFLGMRILKIFAAAFVSIVMTMILFVKPGILVN